ncbi:MAG: dethiobiotin synthase [Megasphaera sp.]|jgi:dethiobiotin synthetase|nr:dethiobiotin synthase [Megasphaera sp.]
MTKGLYVVGTDTDIGKTYVTALLIKTLRQGGYDVAYYKPAISGAKEVAASDAGYVNDIAHIGEDEDLLVSYLYDQAVSPHLAAKLAHRPIEKAVIMRDWQNVTDAYPYVTVEGSGGIVCPIRFDDEAQWLLTDVISWFGLPVIVVASAGLGTINHVVTTCEYIKARHIPIKGILLNDWKGGVMEEDNVAMIEALTGCPVIAKVARGDTILHVEPSRLAALYDSIEGRHEPCATL